ncbi:MAG: T9SS type A sorting domain-containing protein [Candidatus Sabulitectum sp.]|nr:T9SS type A sorting domain-containing protein [Candidatus Sabulitectum sp.]
MKATYLLLILVVAIAWADWVDFGMDGLPSAEITVLEATPSGMLIELVVPGIDINQITREGKIYHELSIPGTIPNTNAEGNPSIPSLSFLAAVSEAGVSNITIEDASWVDLGLYTPAPMQPIPADDSYEAVPFTVVPASYSGAHPSQQASWVSDGVLRGVDIGRINIAPVRWNAETGILSACPRMLVRIEFAGSVSIEQRLHSRFWNSTFQRTLVNADVLGTPVSTVSYSITEPVKATTRRQADDITAADFLIIAGDDFVDTLMDTFIAAKMEQGFLTALVAGGSWSQTEIKAYVQNAYDTWTIPPSFVLFVGDSGDLVPYNTNGMSGDNRYCCVDGSDYMADIFNGRFVTGTSNYPGVEAKVLKWEFDPLMDSSFWNNGLCAGMLQALGGTVADRWFCFTCETVRDTYQDIYGKTFNREYVKDTSQSPPYYYRSDLPSAGQMVPSDIVWDGDAAGILSSINNGVFLIQHRDHGGVSGWADPAFYISDLAGLANGAKTPMVMSINCLTGQFVNNCFAENLFARDNGAVAVVAAVQVSYSYFNDYFCYGLYKSFNDQYTSPPFSYTEPGGDYMGGQALINGKLEMQAAAPYNPYGSWEAYAEDEWDLFQWFGDPTMDMRTDLPHSLTVQSPFSLPSGSTSAVFIVTDANGPVDQAMVCIQHTSGLWASGVTSSDGTVTLTFDAIGAIDDITYMVTAHNALPYEGCINGVGVEETTAGIVSGSVGNPYPNPATSSITFPVTLDGAGSVAITVYDIAGRSVDAIESGILESGSHALVWNVAEVPQGIYMARITDQGGSVTTRRIVIAR